MSIVKVGISSENHNSKNNVLNKKQNIPNVSVTNYLAQDNVSFGGSSAFTNKVENFVVSLMDKMDNGGFAAAFIVGDGLGFIFPRVGMALFRGGPEKKDENGNPILDKNGNPKHELNWAFARKELLREAITGPGSLIIPVLIMKGIKKLFGSANNIKIDTIRTLSDTIKQENLLDGNVDKSKFTNGIYEQIVGKENSKTFVELHNKYLEESAKLANATRSEKKAIKENLKSILAQFEDEFVKVQKQKFPYGNVFEAKIKDKGIGSIKNVPGILEDYYHDLNEFVKKHGDKDLGAVIEKFRGTKAGSRFLTLIGVFSAVAVFFTQIPRLYNIGLKGNPALANENETKEKTNKDVSFSGGASFLEKLSDKVEGNSHLKGIANFMELDGSSISGRLMALLLFGVCLPPRLIFAQDKYDFGEILLRDLSAFSALLFGANILSRVFSDVMTKKTGLGLNENYTKDMNFFKKAIAYMSPTGVKHHVLSSKELIAKYTNIQDYKGDIAGFMEFIEKSGGNVKKAFSHDDDLKTIILDAIKKNSKYKNIKSYEDIPEDAFGLLKNIDKSTKDKIFTIFKSDKNKLLRKAKFANSSFKALSTFLLIPSFIIWLTRKCEKMTENRIAKEKSHSNMDSFTKA